MRIATKLNIGMMIVLAATVASNYTVLQATIGPQFSQIEEQASRTNHKRVLEAFDTLLNRLRTPTQDWSYWDAACLSPSLSPVFV